MQIHRENLFESTTGRWLTVIIILFSIAFLTIINLALGSVSIPFTSVLKVLFHDQAPSIWANIILKSRLPQTVTAILAGAGLAVAGLQMQTLFRNPLAGPSILGISSGASLGVALVVLVSGNLLDTALSHSGLFGELAMTISAFLGAFSILFIIIFMSRMVRGSVSLLIIGIMVGYLASALVGMMKFYSLEEDIHAYVIWGLGSFARISPQQMNIFLPLIMVGILSSLLMAKPLNILLLGENYARNLGLRIQRARMAIILSSGFLTAIITAYCGPIIFLGLAVPHITRNLLNTSDHRWLLPANALAGSLIALACNLVARLPGFDGALPINSVTALIGVPVVLWIMVKRRKEIGEM